MYSYVSQSRSGRLEQVPLVLQAGGNPIPIIKNYFEQLDFAEIEAIFPEQTPEQQQQQAELMRIEAQKQAQLLDLQIMKETKAVEAYKAEQEAFLMESQAKMARLQQEMQKLQSDIELNSAKQKGEMASAAKDMAEAEAQRLENRLVESGALEVIEKAMTLEIPEVKDGEAE
jgi:multidrug efflux pump subunit AcrA (membrane-fusion protein)